jgi:hypothetical protein
MPGEIRLFNQEIKPKLKLADGCVVGQVQTLDADCAKKCVDGGASPVFVSADKVYKIDDPDKVKEHIGHKVIIDGDVDGDTIQISTLKMAE